MWFTMSFRFTNIISIESSWPYWDMIKINDWYESNMTTTTRKEQEPSPQYLQLIQMGKNEASDGIFPKSILEELLTYFHMDGYVNVTYPRNLFFQTSNLDSKIKTWSRSYIENMMEKVEKRN
jgi:hypothetical protein